MNALEEVRVVKPHKLNGKAFSGEEKKHEIQQAD